MSSLTYGSPGNFTFTCGCQESVEITAVRLRSPQRDTPHMIIKVRHANRFVHEWIISDEDIRFNNSAPGFALQVAQDIVTKMFFDSTPQMCNDVSSWSDTLYVLDRLRDG